ncbi:hypothetical protein N8766_03805 [bacterium]|nr:hypothetical protein [bacterium]
MMLTILWFVLIYGMIGFVFAVPFVFRGVDQIDPAAKNASFGFRMLIIPGSLLFWPLLLWRWWFRVVPREEWGQHRKGHRQV